MAKKNKLANEREEKQLEIERAAQMDQFDSLLNKSKEHESENEKPVDDDQNLDLLNFHIKEMRQPKWVEVTKSKGKERPG